MALLNQILTSIQPTIPLREMAVMNVDVPNQKSNNNNPLAASHAELTGALAPMVRISGKYTLKNNNILGMTITQDGFLPSIRLSIYDDNHLLTNVFYPIFDPIVSVYVKSLHPSIKPLRCDFLITSVNASIPDADGIKVYYLEGELYIPRLYGNVSKAYRNMNSTDVLKAVAQDLGLGYASNEESMNDKMTWINPNMSYYKFIEDEIAPRAYKSDKSFFTCFIDRYYIINFINVEKQMAQDLDFDLGYQISDPFKNSDVLKDSSERKEEFSIQQEIAISNHPASNGSIHHIKDHKVTSSNGEILKTDSFRKRVMWYNDGHEDKVVNYFIEPLSNTKTQMGGEHQKPELVDLQNMEVVKWMGQDGSNAHKNNKFAQVLNGHNNIELEKNLLNVELDAINPVIMRGSRLPVTIYTETYFDALKKAALGNVDQIQESANYKAYLDDFLSDLYYVKDIEYEYDLFKQPNPFTTNLVLAKRNWKKQVVN